MEAKFAFLCARVGTGGARAWLMSYPLRTTDSCLNLTIGTSARAGVARPAHSMWMFGLSGLSPLSLLGLAIEVQVDGALLS